MASASADALSIGGGTAINCYGNSFSGHSASAVAWPGGFATVNEKWFGQNGFAQGTTSAAQNGNQIAVTASLTGSGKLKNGQIDPKSQIIFTQNDQEYNLWGSKDLVVNIDAELNNFATVKGSRNGQTSGFDKVNIVATYSGSNKNTDLVDSRWVNNFAELSVENSVQLGAPLQTGTLSIKQLENIGSSRAKAYDVKNNISGVGEIANNANIVQGIEANVLGRATITSDLSNYLDIQANKNVLFVQKFRDVSTLLTKTGTDTQNGLNTAKVKAGYDITGTMTGYQKGTGYWKTADLFQIGYNRYNLTAGHNTRLSPTIEQIAIWKK